MRARSLWSKVLAISRIALVCQLSHIPLKENLYVPYFGVETSDTAATDAVACVTDCGVPNYTVETVPEAPKIPKATNGEEFPWNEVR